MALSTATTESIFQVAFMASIAGFAMLKGGWPRDAYLRGKINLALGIGAFLASIVLLSNETGIKIYALVSMVLGGGLAAGALASMTIHWHREKNPHLVKQPQAARAERPSNSAEADKGYGISPVEAYPARKPRYTFADVQGMEELKSKLREIWPDITGRGMNGILFHGEPGNGKTFVAEALAGQAENMLFLEARIGEVASKWINQTTEQINRIFQAARAQAPCVLFLDEIDSVLRDRAHLFDGGEAEAPRIVNVLLTNIADARSHPEWQVLVIGATNFIDKLDGAGIREGRFDFKIEIPAPDYEARVGLLRNNLPSGFTYENGVPERAAKRWEGFSVIRCKTVAERAGRMASDLGGKTIGFRTLMEALRDVQGARRVNLPEGTPSLDELKFDEDIRSQLQSLANRMMNVEQIEARGGTLPKGVVFGGAPGTGKTAVAKALAITSGWAFLPTTGQGLLSSPATLDELIKKALDLRPAIIFIDEADDILRDRMHNPYGPAATNKLLAMLDGTVALPDVMFIAATNRPEILDDAATRDGRFGEQFKFREPSEETAAAIVEQFMREKWMAPWAADFTPQAAAAMMVGLPPSDVRGRLQAAINRVAGESQGVVSLDVLRQVTQ